MTLTSQKPDNYLVWAILCTLFCCLPFGIVAIIKATQVDSFWAQGYYDSAYKAAADAKKWTWIGVLSIVVLLFIYVILLLLGVFAAVSLS